LTVLHPVDFDGVRGSCGVGKRQAELIENQQEGDEKLKVTAEIMEGRVVGKRCGKEKMEKEKEERRRGRVLGMKRKRRESGGQRHQKQR